METTNQPPDLIGTRVVLLRDLVHSMEGSQFALARNDAEMIARGAARQAELCRHWSLLEDQLRSESEHRARPTPPAGHPLTDSHSSAQLQQEFTALTVRIRHLTRVHCSLLRHLQRSLTILVNMVDSRSPTYTADLSLLNVETRPQAGG